jgi:hypothetical protein
VVRVVVQVPLRPVTVDLVRLRLLVEQLPLLVVAGLALPLTCHQLRLQELQTLETVHHLQQT